MNKKILPTLMVLLLSITLVSAFCNDYSYCYETSCSYADACIEKHFYENLDNSYYFTDGDYLTLSCSASDNILYVSNSEISCNENGCQGSSVSSPYNYYLTPTEDEVWVTCFDISRNSEYYSWTYASSYITMTYVDTSVQEAPETSGLSFIDILVQWIKNFFKSLGLGSLSNQGSGYGYGGGVR